MSLRTSDFDYPLPAGLVAAYPPPVRSDARMMVLDRAAGTVTHTRFADFPSFLRPGDLCLLNNTKVVPARFFTDDGRIELVWLEEPEPGVWRCLVRPGRKMRPGAQVRVGGVVGTVLAVVADGARLVRWDGAVDTARGRLALPPYLGREEEQSDRHRYQTVFARHEGSVAAPTAGLHFTPEMLARLPHAFVTLHVGVGTFRPVQADNLADHEMHAERYVVTPETAAAVNAAGRVVAVGTTTVRVLESVCRGGRPFMPGEGETAIFLHPPYAFQRTGALLTNFHLPKSTLLMLVCALAGRGFVLDAYRQAVAERYRFFSYGDCMLVV